MSRERRRPIILHNSQSGGSITDDTESHSDYHSDSPADDGDWGRQRGGRDDIDPSDSASATAEFSVNHSRGARQPSRQHSAHRQRQPARYNHYPAAVPTPPVGTGEYQHVMDSDSDFYGFALPAGPQRYYDPRYGQSTVGPAQYAPPSHHSHSHSPYGAAQMVPWGAPAQNPFQPHGYFDEHRMTPYQPQGYPVPYTSPGAVVPPNYGVQQHHISHLHYPPPGPPPTDVGERARTPAPPEEKKPDPEFLEMKKQLEAMQLERKKVEEAQARADLEARIREQEERRIKERMEDIRQAQEAASKEIALAKVAAEAAAMERLEEARKAEDERRRMEAELRAQAAREERDRIEAERKAEAQRAKEQAAALEKAERDAKEKYEAAKRDEEDRKAEMARQKELIETETKNKMLAEQKAAEEAKAAAELKAAEAAKQLEIERETLRQKAIHDHEEKLAADKKAIAEAEKAAAAAKQMALDEFVLKAAEDKKKAEEAAAAAEQAKKDAEDLKARILEEGKKAAEVDAKKAAGDDKEPIKFKDAVGRKYSFPWALASEWRTMEGLINQAFAHIEGVGGHVMEGHYDLEGPEGELILKEIWANTIQPGWQITMKMWPEGQHHPLRHQQRAHGGHHGHGRGANIPIPNNIPANEREAWVRQHIFQLHQQQQQRAAMAGQVPMRPGFGQPGGPQMRPPSRGAPYGPFSGPNGRPPPEMPPGVSVVREAKKEGRKQKRSSGWGVLFGTGPAKKSSSKNRKGK